MTFSTYFSPTVHLKKLLRLFWQEKQHKKDLVVNSSGEYEETFDINGVPYDEAKSKYTNLIHKLTSYEQLSGEAEIQVQTDVLHGFVRDQFGEPSVDNDRLRIFAVCKHCTVSCQIGYTSSNSLCVRSLDGEHRVRLEHLKRCEKRKGKSTFQLDEKFKENPRLDLLYTEEELPT
ncbi:hypothetical protein M3Y96_01140300 [Aphelenchoides besseyi]|nr:hypothetical protein M3Y96_01140300 [Aphelenchoides besseyi]